jgi:hypothetical protein
MNGIATQSQTRGEDEEGGVERLERFERALLTGSRNL